jgi:hypothetical protein
MNRLTACDATKETSGGMAARVPRAVANGRIHLPRGIQPEANGVI